MNKTVLVWFPSLTWVDILMTTRPPRRIFGITASWYPTRAVLTVAALVLVASGVNGTSVTVVGGSGAFGKAASSNGRRSPSQPCCWRSNCSNWIHPFGKLPVSSVWRTTPPIVCITSFVRRSCAPLRTLPPSSESCNSTHRTLEDGEKENGVAVLQAKYRSSVSSSEGGRYGSRSCRT